ncbi:MAG: hypothetical protein LBB85_00285 [Dysgonamonadaceae bacterium]|nr:hypothetical protein [Dysgonamonadaceae bacterium]
MVVDKWIRIVDKMKILESTARSQALKKLAQVFGIDLGKHSSKPKRPEYLSITGLLRASPSQFELAKIDYLLSD